MDPTKPSPETLNGWEPERTAPNDGTVVLVWRAGAQRACTGYVNENNEWAYHEKGWPKNVDTVTHWRPLPGAPRARMDCRHTYKPHADHPWFCAHCGYAEHEKLLHV